MNFESLSPPVKVMTETRLGQETESIISLTRFGFTLGRTGSVAKKPEIRAIVKDLISDNPHEYSNLCTIPTPESIKDVIKLEYQGIKHKTVKRCYSMNFCSHYLNS